MLDGRDVHAYASCTVKKRSTARCRGVRRGFCFSAVVLASLACGEIERNEQTHVGRQAGAAGATGVAGAPDSPNPICDEHVNAVITQAIASTLGLNDRDSFSHAELESITRLQVRGISSFEGFQCLTGLLSLVVTASSASDLSPIAALPLVDLSIGISSAPDLASLTVGADTLVRSLARLSLIGNHISDLKGLGALSSLVELNLSENEVTNVSELGALANLQQLDLSKNRINDLVPLSPLAALEQLDLDQNELVSLAGLSLPKLALLDVSQNHLTDLSSLAAPALFALHAMGNRLTTLGDVSGIPTLSILDLQDNQLSSLAGIDALCQLSDLTLAANPFADLTPVAGLVQLKSLILYDTLVAELSPLQGLSKLEQLNIQRTQVTTVRPLLAIPATSNPCKALQLSQAPLDQDSTDAVIPLLCSGGWQVSGDAFVFCENKDCKAI